MQGVHNLNPTQAPAAGTNTRYPIWSRSIFDMEPYTSTVLADASGTSKLDVSQAASVTEWQNKRPGKLSGLFWHSVVLILRGAL
jgi:hypothetical protein